MRPLVSVVVPVYNVEKYLASCLDSILNQDYQNIEVICVNDGSTDCSLGVLQKYQREDERIVIVNQSNQGLAAARNTGLMNAKGDFVLFVDSDDWLNRSAISLSLAFCEKQEVDLVCFGVRCCCDDGNVRIGTKYLKNEILIPDKSWLTAISVTAWSKLYRASFLKKNSLRFPAGLFYEDNPFYWECVSCARMWGVWKEILYNYRTRAQSIMADTRSKKRGMAIHYLHGLQYVHDRWVTNDYIKKNGDLFLWLFEDYVRLGYQCLNVDDRAEYVSEVGACVKRWGIRLRKWTMPYDLINDKNIVMNKYRFMRSLHKRQLKLSSFLGRLL